MKNRSKHGLQHGLHPLGTKPVDGAEVRTLSARDPHEHDVFTDSLGNLSREVDALGVGVDDDFGKHLRMIAISSASRVSRVKDGVVEPIHGLHSRRERGDFEECLLLNPLEDTVDPWYVEYTKKPLFL